MVRLLKKQYHIHMIKINVEYGDVYGDIVISW